MGIGITLITRTTVVGFFIKVFSKNTGKKSRQIALGGSGYPIPSSYSAVGAGGLGGGIYGLLKFGQISLPYFKQKANYANHITNAPPDF